MISKGQKINDRYEIIKSIGEGGMANVYLANDTILDRMVAVKVLRGDLSDDKFVRRFEREALSVSNLSHPNIVEVYDVGEDNGQYFIVMEYIEGKNLKDLLKKRGKLTTTEVVDIMSQIADGLSVAHDSYIIHRDIKPQNIMILENGLVKITDFGIAMAMNATQLTQTNSVMGSVHYLPPEQASGKGSTLKSDIYSMGILMYELLVGVLPYRGDNAVEIALKHLKEPLPSIREELPDVPQSVENIILKSAAKNPKNRYNDAREMYEDLKTCLDESRKDELKYEYQYPELDSDGKKFTKQVEEAVAMEDEDVAIKEVTDEDVRKENKLLIFLASIFVGLVLIVAVLVMFLPKLLNQKDIIVPDVSGMTVTDAISKLQDEGFTVKDEQIEIADEEIVAGNVVKTMPATGTKRSKGTEVTIYISAGDEKIEIENYVGKDYREVKGALESKGLSVIITREETKDKKAKQGVIIKQSVEAGEKLNARDTITLTIPDLDDTYPDFTNGTFSVQDVQDFCDEHGVKLVIKDGTCDKGKICKQSRPEGYTVRSNTALEIFVGTDLPSGEEEPQGCNELDGTNCD